MVFLYVAPPPRMDEKPTERACNHALAVLQYLHDQSKAAWDESAAERAYHMCEEFMEDVGYVDRVSGASGASGASR